MTAPSQVLQLDEGVSVLLGATGGGTVTIGPKRVGQTWRVRSAGVQVATNTLEPTAKLYLGGASPSNFLGGSYTGSNDSDNQLDVLLFRGQVLTCVWSGGDVGARATLSLYGEIHVQ